MAKVAVPSQRRPQREGPLLNEQDHVIRSTRLFRDVNSQESKPHPGEQRSGSGKQETSDFHKKDFG